ncbi:MAG: (2Fe-2S) ferredoxin domain-containing protein [Verrucomicrobia bacterium]|nr:(2Fe-2S) ferredoxin domain-containing protein [Leptolyngbya sp. ES-bin-22]
MSKTGRSTFSLEGRLLDCVFEDGTPKRLRLLTADGECSVKLAKEARTAIGEDTIPGAWLQVWGEQKTSHKHQQPTLKAYKVSVLSPGKTDASSIAVPKPTVPKPAASAKILVCQKSDCMKRGGKAVCQALETALSDRHLTDVKIQGTGCMKYCKAGPNVVFMPEKTRYSRVSARDVGALVDEHFPGESALEPSRHTDSRSTQ